MPDIKIDKDITITEKAAKEVRQIQSENNIPENTFNVISSQKVQETC